MSPTVAGTPNDHPPPRFVADERTTLLTLLGYLRDCVVRKVEDVDDDAARTTPLPSGNNLLGLIRHLTNVERYWAHHVIAGEQTERIMDEFNVPADVTLVSALADYRTTADHTDEVAATGDLGAKGANPDFAGNEVSLRWVLVHLVEETGRHAGHVDIIREELDGTLGR